MRLELKSALAAAATIALLAVASPEDLTAPPPGIKPTSVSLATVLKRHVAKATRAASSGFERWNITYGEMSGWRTDAWSNEAFRSDEMLGPFHTAYGDDGKHGWHMNRNGEVVIESGVHTRDDVDREALAHAAASSRDVVLLGTTASPNAYVVRVSPNGGRIEYLFFDTATYRLVREESVREGRRMTETFDDYKRLGGRVVASHVRIEDGKPENLRDERLVEATFGPVAPQTVSVATPGPPIVTVGDGDGMVPATFVDDRIVLPLKIGTHTVDVQLDSGAGGIFIDSHIIKALGIKEYGRVIGATAGEYTASDAVIPSFSLGPLTFNNVEVESAPFEMMANDKTPVVGLMGFDLLAEMVVQIDYAHGTVRAIDPKRFVPPSDAVTIPISLDDDIPILHASIAGIRSASFGLDTGADRSLLFSEFATAHKREIPERGLGAEMEAASPFVSEFSGVGGRVAYRPLETGPFSLASWNFDRWLFDVTQQAPTFDIEDYAGLIGQDVLRYFDVYFDYPHARIYLRANDRYRNRFG